MNTGSKRLTKPLQPWYNTCMAKRKWDRFDEEAEREATAIRNTTILRASGWGKGITKQRNMHKMGETKITSRVVGRLGVMK